MIFLAATSPPPGTLQERLHCLLGLFAFLLIAFLLGRLRHGRSPIPWRTILWGIALQCVFAAVVIWTPGILNKTNATIQALLNYTKDGARMVFGNLADYAVPVTGADGKPAGVAVTAAVFAFFVLPTIIFFSALTAILYHTGIMQWVVQGLAWIMSKSMKTSGAETLSAAANIFVGQTEAPLMVKPFVAMATRSELMCIMVGGFANIATGVLGIYTDWLGPFIHNVGGHLAAACFISAPASILIAKLLYPETQTPVTQGGVQFKVERIDANVLDATTRGTFEGLHLALNVGAMLIAFTAIVALLNGIIAYTGAQAGLKTPLTLQKILGGILAPIAWLTGIPWADSPEVGSLLGIKTVLNELIAYQNMQQMFQANATFISPRSAVIAAYALCGFANFASVGIQIGGISSLAPERRHDLSKIALWAMLGGALASHTTACVVGVFM